jgi:hypothetical protein
MQFMELIECQQRMTSVQKQFAIAMLMVSGAVAQNTGRPATVQSVKSARAGTDLRLEIDLSSPVTPSVETAENPTRILLDFPETIVGARMQDISIHTNGVRQVRIKQHSIAPPVTRIVLDLDQSVPYVVTAEGNRIVLTVETVEKSHAPSHGAPVAATSGNLIAVFRKRKNNSAPVADTPDDTPLPAPPPALSGPAFEPQSEKTPAVAATSPATAPAPPQAAAGTQTQAAPANPIQIASAPKPDDAISSRATASVVVPNRAPAHEPKATKSQELENPPADLDASAAPIAPIETPETRTPIVRSDDPNLRTVFKVKYVAEGVAYLEGGRAQGLSEGTKLEIQDSNLPARQGDSANAADPRVIAELVVSAVAETSAVTDIHQPKRAVKVGDLAYLSSGDAEALVQQRALSATRQYPAVISFTEGDALDEEAREEVPRPPLPSVNRARGRIGFDSIETISHGATNITSTDVGVVFRGDITRIGGTYWNLSGYWRGRITKESVTNQQTLQNLINRTYHLNMTYDNPNSTLVAGFGRLYLPWAPSLDTIDGGYFGKRISKGAVLGVFGGSTPDPSSWDYSPNRVLSGGFINFEGGEYDGFHYSSTSGAGISMVNWAIDRPFVFFEDSLSFKRTIAVYESAQLDSPRGNSVTPAPGPGLGRNFFTLRVNPHSKVELDFNYNYFRDVPTFDPNLIGTSLLDKYLFQGFSVGGRVEVWKQIWLSTNLGRSNGTGDAKGSLNEMYGVTFGRLPWVHLRADAHYAQFNSSFGSGSYESFSLSRQLSDRLRLEVLAGQQNFASTLTTATRGRFVTGTVETTLGPHYYLQGNFTTNRGDMSYDQIMFSIGYRFDSHRRGE